MARGLGEMTHLRAEPIAAVLLEPVDQPGDEAWDDSAGLRDFLHSVEAWAAEPGDTGSPEMWGRAARALIGGVVYE